MLSKEDPFWNGYAQTSFKFPSLAWITQPHNYFCGFFISKDADADTCCSIQISTVLHMKTHAHTQACCTLSTNKQGSLLFTLTHGWRSSFLPGKPVLPLLLPLLTCSPGKCQSKTHNAGASVWVTGISHPLGVPLPDIKKVGKWGGCTGEQSTERSSAGCTLLHCQFEIGCQILHPHP